VNLKQRPHLCIAMIASMVEEEVEGVVEEEGGEAVGEEVEEEVEEENKMIEVNGKRRNNTSIFILFV
jgi:hypothetical protein